MKLTYDEWRRHVDEIVHNTTGGLTTSDLPDINYRELYDMEESPHETARIALDEAGWSPGEGA